MDPENIRVVAATRLASLLGQSQPSPGPDPTAGLADALLQYIPPGALGSPPMPLSAPTSTADELADALLRYQSTSAPGSPASLGLSLGAAGSDDQTPLYDPDSGSGSATIYSADRVGTPTTDQLNLHSPGSGVSSFAGNLQDSSPTFSGSAQVRPLGFLSRAPSPSNPGSPLTNFPPSPSDLNERPDPSTAAQANWQEGQSSPALVQLATRSGRSNAWAPSNQSNSAASSSQAFVQSPFIGPNGERYYEKVVAKNGGRQTILRVDDRGRLVETYSEDLGEARDAPGLFDLIGPNEFKTALETLGIPLAKVGLKAGLAALKGLAPKVAAIPFGAAEREAARLAAEDAAARAPNSLEGGAELKPYGGSGGGHHVPAKSMMAGEPAYDANRALAVPNAELARWDVDHDGVSTAQQALYRSLSKEGKPLTWDDVQNIETQALIHGRMPPDVAYATVRRAIESLKSIGISAPTRIPWSR
jgi:hypothetical protein